VSRRTLLASLGLLVLFANPRVRADDPPGEPVVGVGLSLGKDADSDDYPTVKDILKAAPAHKDGRIKLGDLIAGVEDDAGKRTDFKGKKLEEIVRHIRGPAGTTVKLVVIPKGKDKDDSKVIELTREPIQS
jgi:carboxyl-terminal processing protease